MKPAYRDGDIIIVSPAAPVRKGDRVVVKTKRRRGDGQGIAAQEHEERSSSNRSTPSTATARLPMNEIDWIARIMWASQ